MGQNVSTEKPQEPGKAKHASPDDSDVEEQTTQPAPDARYRFRHSVAVPIAGAVALVGSSALATQRWWLTPLLVIPLLAIWWGLRSGVDIDASGLYVRRWWRPRFVRWGELAGFTVQGVKVRAELVDDSEPITLPSITPQHVTGLLELARAYNGGGQPPTVEADTLQP